VRRGWPERRLLRDLAAALRPRDRVLDAGCGTGRIAGRIAALEPSARLTMVDVSEGMLGRAAGVPGARMRGSVERLPFPDSCFDVVVCCWVLETVTDPPHALRECLRVLAPGGRLFCAFSAPEGRLRRWLTCPLRWLVGTRFAGRFLPLAEMVPAERASLRLYRARSQLAAALVLERT
jgi:ubiquinone/menaquinone biosynthesis C-methylase UbiE